jgi:nitrate reductase alpha subunit
VCLSFYDWYCDLPPASPQTWGEQTDVPESADWYNSTFIMMWGSNVPQTRTPDAHFLTEARYRGTKVVSVFPDYAEGASSATCGCTRSRAPTRRSALAMGHVILKEFTWRATATTSSTTQALHDMPALVRLVPHGDGYVPERSCARPTSTAARRGRASRLEDRDDRRANGEFVVPVGSIGFRWGQQADADKGKWNLRGETSKGAALAPRLSCTAAHDDVVDVLPVLRQPASRSFQLDAPRLRTVAPDRRAARRDAQRRDAGRDRLRPVRRELRPRPGLGGRDVAASYDDDIPYTPAWQEAITGVPRADVISVARQFADNAQDAGQVDGDHRRG